MMDFGLVLFNINFAQLVTVLTLTDAIEYGQLNSGQRNEAVVLAVRPMIDKLTGAISNGLVGYIAIAAGMTGSATAADMTGHDIRTFDSMAFYIPLALAVLSIFVFLFKVKLSEEVHAEVVEELKDKLAQGELTSEASTSSTGLKEETIYAPTDGELVAMKEVVDRDGQPFPGKGFAIGSAALTALALIASYVEKVQEVGGDSVVLDMSVMNPAVLIGLFIGACLPFIFAALTMSSVGRAAQSIVVEVRRQFREIKGLMEGKADADYEKCVDICTKSSLKEMVLPTLLAIITPVVVGLVLGYNGVIGMLAGSTATGFLMAVFMSNAGGAWDNAKKYIESGKHGGKGSDAHKAAVVGDTVGDPFKDTSGPSINILIKLLSMVSIVFAALVVNFHIF